MYAGGCCLMHRSFEKLGVPLRRIVAVAVKAMSDRASLTTNGRNYVDVAATFGDHGAYISPHALQLQHVCNGIQKVM
jgi:hypothetical protein